MKSGQGPATCALCLVRTYLVDDIPASCLKGFGLRPAGTVLRCTRMVIAQCIYMVSSVGDYSF